MYVVVKLRTQTITNIKIATTTLVIIISTTSFVTIVTSTTVASYTSSTTPLSSNPNSKSASSSNLESHKEASSISPTDRRIGSSTVVGSNLIGSFEESLCIFRSSDHKHFDCFSPEI